MERTSYRPGTPCWIDLGSPDPKAAADFYAGLFGWTCEPGPPEAGGYVMCLLNGHPVAGIGHAQQEGRPFWTTYLSVADVEATTAAVRSAGGTVLVEPMEVMAFGRMAVYVDPTGAQFSAWQPGSMAGAGLVNEPGALCWNELTTREVATARRFYTEVFGLECTELPMEGITYTEFRVDGESVAGLMPMDDGWPSEIPSHWMTYFAVADTDATAARATELGGVVHVPPTDIPPGRFSVIADPFGAAFSVLRITSPPVDGA